MIPEELTGKLVAWIKEKVLAGRCTGVVLGMSGGIDSSVAAVLCQRAFPQSALGVLMPCYSIPEDEHHAMAVAGKFSIPTRTVVLDSVFDAMVRALPDNDTDPAVPLAKANLKARLRMLTLYYLANQLKYMVVGASNRSELATGYFTKHGDSGADILPLGNLLKRQVREMAGFLGIPQEIINKPPSAGLWAGQTDEHDFGFSYDELDCYLTDGKAPGEVKEKIKAMMVANVHKRQPPPIPDF